jgi:hypothetical protein
LADPSPPSRPRTLFSVTGDGVGLLTISHRNWTKPAVISATPMAFGALLISSVPKGARFDLQLA